jgi:eukaryotic-like serine/threonine-protein kinase
LYVVTLAYAGRSVDALRTWETPDERLYLFAAYVERMFQRRSAITDYTRQEAERWLAWLAWQLTQHNQTVFYLERMQPDWLPGGQSWVPIHAARLMASLLGGLVMGLLGWQAGGLHVRLAWGYHPGSESEIELGWGLLGGLVGGLVGIQAGYAKEITTIETVRWSWSGFLTELFLPSGGRLVRGWAVGLLGGLFIGLGQGLDVTFAAVKDSKLTHWEAWWSDGLSYGLKGGMGVWFGVILVSGLGAILGFGLGSGLSWGLGSGLSFEVAGGLTLGLLIGLVYKLSSGFVAGLSGSEITTKTTPNEGIHRSARMALISGVGSGLAGGVISGLVIGLANVVLSGLSLGLLSELTQGVHYGLRRGLVYGLIFGLICGVISGLTAGIRYGGWTCVQHLLLRLMLRYNSLAPWQYVNFLDYAVERILLRKVGGGYMFIHRRLQEYFAARHVEPGGGSGAAAS